MKNWHILSVYFLETCKIGTYNGNVMKVGADSFCIISDSVQEKPVDQLKTACASLGATLLKPTSDEMNKAIVDALYNQAFYPNPFMAPALLDATDETKEGTWTDLGGNPLTYTNWAQNQPLVSSDQNYAVFDFYSFPVPGKWSTTGSSDTAYLVCQKKLTRKS